MHIRTLVAAALIPAALATTSCREEAASGPVTTNEAQQAVVEAALSGEAESVTSGSIEVATEFTIGQAVENAAQEIGAFVNTQLPCAEVTLSGATVSINYGAKAGNCTYKGHTYKGTHSITISKNDMSEVVVDHAWTKLSNGVVEVTGTAEVTWSLADKTRHVVHELDWKRLADGKTGKGEGDRTQAPLVDGLDQGIRVDGMRQWTTTAGQWDLAIEGVEMRWSDPVPQAGTYRLASPKGRSFTLSFERVDSDTIKVTVTSGTATSSFEVSKGGDVSGG
jgi:hypothetical protein